MVDDEKTRIMAKANSLYKLIIDWMDKEIPLKIDEHTATEIFSSFSLAIGVWIGRNTTFWITDADQFAAFAQIHINLIKAACDDTLNGNNLGVTH